MPEHIRTLLILLLSCLTWQLSFAKHIIGGDLHYECIGNGMYRITMIIYRDCRPQEMAAPFDGDGDNTQGAYVALYRGNGSSFAFQRQLVVPLRSQGNIAPPDYPCLIPPDNLCVEKGEYRFDIEIPDWPSSESYYLVYQRCCRNNTISNIVDPGSNGATYAIEITPEAQLNCNNSPVFNEFPPTVVCVANDFQFDHSASDAEGDSLVYSFCNPLKGGGLIGDRANPGNPSACNGIRPSPPCTPPFAQVAFSTGYSDQTPMAGNPVVIIDPMTGLISGTPQVIGQFVVGVCVKEYRAGVEIGEIRRDFQFNVADCDPTVFAMVKSEAKLGDREFVINSCGNNTIFFENESILEQYIKSYRWEFDIAGRSEVITSRDAEVTFPGIGTYRGVMMVNPGLDCGDTADIYVNLYPSITADFTFDYDTCVGGPVTLKDQSVTGANRIESYSWEFGDGGISNLKDPRYTYRNPGVHMISLTVTDDNECVDEQIYPIRYFPVPPILIIEPSSFVGCSPAKIFFNNLSEPVDSTYTIEWDFGDGATGSAVSPTNVYPEFGVYSVNLRITSPIGCTTSASFPNWIEVKESPISEFSFLPEEPSSFNPRVEFTNLSSNYVDQRWIFDASGRSQERDPTFVFPDTGLYQVALIAIHENGCRDTSLQEILVLPRVTYHMPNAFTPNGDGKNDIFLGAGFTAGMKDFEMTIWSRWGELLFRSEDPEEGWNGTRQNQGDDLPLGVYVYQVHYTNPKGEPIELRGFATLVR
jgi:gliding motility-associated-like protein